MILTTLPYLMNYLLYDDNLYIATVGKILHLMQNATQDQTEISRTSYGVQFEQFCEMRTAQLEYRFRTFDVTEAKIGSFPAAV